MPFRCGTALTKINHLNSNSPFQHQQQFSSIYPLHLQYYFSPERIVTPKRGEAVQLVKAFLPEVVVIDACMPGMDGLAATRLIKKNWPQIRVVVLTMYADQRQAALAAGADTFLMKGCLAETLFEAILT